GRVPARDGKAFARIEPIRFRGCMLALPKNHRGNYSAAGAGFTDHSDARATCESSEAEGTGAQDAGRSGCSVRFRFVEIFAGRKIFVFTEVIRAKWFGDLVFLVEPLAKIDQLATMGTERAVRLIKPRPFLLTHGTSD